ncbi:MAG: PilZ domain-containing protein [Ketobacteraceae bacterium]|nr:PilZ domain-containing protein [Ketobacteraceae bacterium]
MEDNYDERRRAPRSDIQDTLFIKSISSSQVTSFSSDFKTCNTVNVSAYGMQVILDFEVLVDSEIALWVVQDDTGERTLVDGTVRWTSKTAGDHKYLVGIELNEQSVSTIEQWIENTDTSPSGDE